jgi:hypothetical protein
MLNANLSISECIKCVQREIALRQNVYPKWVADPKKPNWTDEFARSEIRGMQNVLAYLQFLEGAAKSFSMNVLIDAGKPDK